MGKAEIAAALRALGVQSGMGLMVHSSLRSLGYVRGGAAAVIEALQETVGPQGTIMMPSFNHGRLFEGGEPIPFDPAHTPTSSGLIAETFRKCPGVLRSLDPYHPFACWGNRALRYTAHHHRAATMGAGSPLGMLCADGGYGLLLGVGYGANSLHHVAETINASPCLGLRTRSHPVRLPGGRIVQGRAWNWRDGNCPHTDTTSYAAIMKERNLERVGMIGASRCTLFRLADCLNVVLELLRNGNGDKPPCSGCPVRPRHSANDAACDWDAVSGALLGDSEAWTY